MTTFRVDTVAASFVNGTLSSNIKDYKVPCGMQSIVYLGKEQPRIADFHAKGVLVFSKWQGPSNYQGDYKPYFVKVLI